MSTFDGYATLDLRPGADLAAFVEAVGAVAAEQGTSVEVYRDQEDRGARCAVLAWAEPLPGGTRRLRLLGGMGLGILVRDIMVARPELVARALVGTDMDEFGSEHVAYVPAGQGQRPRLVHRAQVPSEELVEFVPRDEAVRQAQDERALAELAALFGVAPDRLRVVAAGFDGRHPGVGLKMTGFIDWWEALGADWREPDDGAVVVLGLDEHGPYGTCGTWHRM